MKYNKEQRDLDRKIRKQVRRVRIEGRRREWWEKEREVQVGEGEMEGRKERRRGRGGEKL